MCQNKIIKYLEKYGKGTTKEMAKQFGIAENNINNSLKKLRKYNEVRFKLEEFGGNHRRYIYYPV